MSVLRHALMTTSRRFLVLQMGVANGTATTTAATVLSRRSLASLAAATNGRVGRMLVLPFGRTPARALPRQTQRAGTTGAQARRMLSEDAAAGGKGSGGAKQQPKQGGEQKPQYGNNPNQTQLQTWTVAKGVKTGMTLSLQLGLAGLVLVCGGLIVKELLPTKMSPNAVFDTAFDRLQKDDAVIKYFGKNLKAYGRDRSRGAAGLGKVEGRRNFIDHVEYDDEAGVHHTRVLFNIEGSTRKGVVYADVSKEMASGQFLYLLVQDRANPARTFAVVDNRPQTPFAVRQGEIADHLLKKGAVLYGSNSEPNTVRQLEMFGEACKQLKYVDCHKQPEVCAAAGIEALPTWTFNGQKEVGVKDIEDLYTRASKHRASVFKNM